MLERWIVDRGVSLSSRTSFLRSLRATEAILVMRLSAMPAAIFDIVEVLQGAMTNESNLTEPEASGEYMSSLA
jgi:hypothetical protein